MGSVSAESAAQQAPMMLGAVYEFLSEKLPKVSEDKLKMAAMVLDESGRRADELDPLECAEDADQTAGELRRIFTDT